MALSTGEHNAYAKAIRLSGADLVQRVEFGLYVVVSATRDTTHTVTGTTDLRCDCEAATFGRACWHVAAVKLARAKRAAARRLRSGDAITPTAAPVVAPAAAMLPGETIRRHAGLKRVELV